MTRPVRIPSRWARFARQTVWHPINTDPADENRWGPRFWFPTYDVIALILGIYAYFYGSPLLNQLFPPWLTDVMGVALIIAAVICLIGVVFPRLAIIELLGKLLIVFMLGAYAGTVAFLSSASNNGFVVTTLIMSVWLLGPRISVLFAQIPKAVRARAEARKHAKGGR